MDATYCHFCCGPMDEPADVRRGACLPCYAASGEPLTVADRLRLMPTGRAARALWRLIARESFAFDWIGRERGRLPGPAVAWNIDREPAVVAARFKDGSAVAVRYNKRDL